MTGLSFQRAVKIINENDFPVLSVRLCLPKTASYQAFKLILLLFCNTPPSLIHFQSYMEDLLMNWIIFFIISLLYLACLLKFGWSCPGFSQSSDWG